MMLGRCFDVGDDLYIENLASRDKQCPPFGHCFFGGDAPLLARVLSTMLKTKQKSSKTFRLRLKMPPHPPPPIVCGENVTDISTQHVSCLRKNVQKRCCLLGQNLNTQIKIEQCCKHSSCACCAIRALSQSHVRQRNRATAGHLL